RCCRPWTRPARKTRCISLKCRHPAALVLEFFLTRGVDTMAVSRIATEQEKLIASLEPPLGRLAARGLLRSYRKNSIVLNEGDTGDSLFVILQGQVKVYATDENGREITYGTIQAGDYFGEMSL